MSSAEKPRQNIPGYYISRGPGGLLTAMYQGPNVVACVGEFPVLFACATDPDPLVAAVADGQRAGKLPRVVAQ
ncbi:MAG: hypothetical protein JWN00_3486 [Actinomycetia bacterium]|nr:hypothetical protein [Actinomycetes bacterium]